MDQVSVSRVPRPVAGVRAMGGMGWEARWDHAGPYRQKIVPYPNAHPSFGGRADVNGVCSGYGRSTGPH